MEKNTIILLMQRFNDAMAIIISMYLAYSFTSQPQTAYQSIVLITTISVMISLWLYPKFGLYQAWRGGSKLKELSIAAYCWTSNQFIVGAIYYFAHKQLLSQNHFFVVWYISGLLILLTMRLVVRYLLNYLRARGYDRKNIIIIGDGSTASNAATILKKVSWAGYNIVGSFGDYDVQGTKRLGDFNEIENYLAKNGENLEQIWITMSFADRELIKQIIFSLRHATQTIRYLPDVDAFRLINNSTSEVAGLHLFNISASPMTGFNRVLKNIEDKIISLLILLLISPLLILLSIGVKLTSPGPVFYKQERVSWNGKRFNMYKFRSMPVNNEKDGVTWGGASNKTNTKFGQFIRATSLDELPQFFNVLLGDMSIVGPRPERTIFVEKFKDEIPGYMQKHMVKAGITGWAQINGWRGDTDLSKRVEYDLYYIKNWSVIFDLKIIFLTIFKGFVNENAK